MNTKQILAERVRCRIAQEASALSHEAVVSLVAERNELRDKVRELEQQARELARRVDEKFALQTQAESKVRELDSIAHGLDEDLAWDMRKRRELEQRVAELEAFKAEQMDREELLRQDLIQTRTDLAIQTGHTLRAAARV